MACALWWRDNFGVLLLILTAKILICLLPMPLFGAAGYRKWKTVYPEGSVLGYCFRQFTMRNGPDDVASIRLPRIAATFTWFVIATLVLF